MCPNCDVLLKKMCFDQILTAVAKEKTRKGLLKEGGPDLAVRLSMKKKKVKIYMKKHLQLVL